jgi:hypothetical protein
MLENDNEMGKGEGNKRLTGTDYFGINESLMRDLPSNDSTKTLLSILACEPIEPLSVDTSKALASEALLYELSEPATQSTDSMLGLRTMMGWLTWTDLIWIVSWGCSMQGAARTEDSLTGARTLTGFAFWKEIGVAVLKTNPRMAAPLAAVDEALVRVIGVALSAAAKVSA